jgi:hypothetical protein
MLRALALYSTDRKLNLVYARYAQILKLLLVLIQSVTGMTHVVPLIVKKITG